MKRLIIFIIFIVGLLLVYNLFFADRSLEDLRFAYDQTGRAYSLDDIDGVDMILTQAIVARSAVSPPLVSRFASISGSPEIADLEFINNMIAADKHYGQLDYVKTMLGAAIKEREKERGPVLSVLDKINSPIKNKVISFFDLSRYFPSKVVKKAPFAKSEAIALFEKARELEKEGSLQNAIKDYEELAREFPGYKKTPLAKLRLAYAYQRSGEPDKAISLYKEMIRTSPDAKEARIARVFLDGLRHKDKLLQETYSLLIRSDELSDDQIEEKQDVYYQLGQIYTRMFDFEDARKSFKRVVTLDPSSYIAMQAQFDLGWIYKQQGKPEKGAKDLIRLLKEAPAGDLALDGQYQLANLYHAEGKYEKAIELYMKIAEENKDLPLAALCLFQAGASYMYDLNDKEKADGIFARLEKKHPESPYAAYVKGGEENPIEIFLTFLVPRATRLASWRAMGLLCLAGYSGEIVKVKASSREERFNLSFNTWIRKEFPNTVGNMYVDVKGAEVVFEENKYLISGTLSFGKFSLKGRAECYLELTKEKKVMLKFTKAFLGNVPIHPALINNPLTGISLIIRRYFPVIVTDISMKEGESFAEGFASKRMAERVKETSQKKFQGIEIEIEDIESPAEQDEIYARFKKEFPESDFSPSPEYGAEDMFLDFFTRMCLYSTVKLAETVKDSKLDFQRSIRKLGRLMLKEENFSVTYTDDHVNVSLNRFINYEFPWIVDKKFLFDIKGTEFHFKDNGEIWFDQHLVLGYGNPPTRSNDIKVKGKMVLQIDRESELPRMVFKEVTLNGTSFPVEKLNLLSDRLLGLLNDARIPFKLKEIDVYEDHITMKGEGARDFTDRIFSDPHLFVIFHVRKWDLGVAGIKRLRERPEMPPDYWRGEVPKGGKERR